MRQSRTMQGCYANWTVTVTTEPPDEGGAAVGVPAQVMTSVWDTFRLAVNCYELGRDMDRVEPRRR